MRQLFENKNSDKVQAIIPNNLGKIQKPIVHISEIWKVINKLEGVKLSIKRSATLENSGQQRKYDRTNSASVDPIERNQIERYKTFANSSPERNLIVRSSLNSNETSLRRNLVGSRPQSAIRYPSQNRSIYAPGVVRVIQKHTRQMSVISEMRSNSPIKTNRPSYNTERKITVPSASIAYQTSVLPMSHKDQIEKPALENYDEVYVGEYVHGKRHGNGKVTYKNGDIFIGEFYEGKKQGPGDLILANSKIQFSGLWYNDQKHGPGKIKSPNAEIEAKWEKDILNENDLKLTYDSGYVYQGETRNGMRHGNGKMTYEGAEYFGIWYEDKREKHGYIKYKDHYFFEGHFHNDSTNGSGVLIKNDVIKLNKANSIYSRTLEKYKKPNIVMEDYTVPFPEFSKINLKSTDVVYITAPANPHRHLPAGAFKSGKLNG